jgi:hypothetical protein
MKLIALAFSAVVGLAAAQLEMLSEVPQCAVRCLAVSFDCMIVLLTYCCSLSASPEPS